MNNLIPDEVIINKIYLIRNQKVMLDRDLAHLYGVETKYLKRQVKRNLIRFPSDFMFELTNDEMENWRSQFGTSNSDKMGLRYLPYAFTEDGVAQLSTVLKSSSAIEVNIQIIRLFSRMRKILMTHKDILIKLEQLEKGMLIQNNRTNKQEAEIQVIFDALKQLLTPPSEPRDPIGFKTKQ